MKKNFFILSTLLSVCCANVNNASCDCCRFGKEKNFIAKALGIKKGDIWFIEKFNGKNFEEEIKTFFNKKGEDFKNRAENSHMVILAEGNVDGSGKFKADDACFFCALIDKEKNINPSSELLNKENNIETFYANNKDKKVKIIKVIKSGEDDGKFYSCKKN